LSQYAPAALNAARLLLSSSALLALGLVTACNVAAPEKAERVPQIGLAGDDLDACVSVGEVTDLIPGGDHFLVVRAEPSATGRAKDRLGPGRWLWLCDEAGEWLGVVYSAKPGEKPGECGVGTPADRVRPYDGPCRWGWVHSRYVEVVAG
jgi:hypothetical protein